LVATFTVAAAIWLVVWLVVSAFAFDGLGNNLDPDYESKTFAAVMGLVAGTAPVVAVVVWSAEKPRARRTVAICIAVTALAWLLHASTD
jgi:hypothetical protein